MSFAWWYGTCSVLQAPRKMSPSLQRTAGGVWAVSQPRGLGSQHENLPFLPTGCSHCTFRLCWAGTAHMCASSRPSHTLQSVSEAHSSHVHTRVTKMLLCAQTAVCVKSAMKTSESPRAARLDLNRGPFRPESPPGPLSPKASLKTRWQGFLKGRTWGLQAPKGQQVPAMLATSVEAEVGEEERGKRESCSLSKGC